MRGRVCGAAGGGSAVERLEQEVLWQVTRTRKGDGQHPIVAGLGHSMPCQRAAG